MVSILSCFVWDEKSKKNPKIREAIEGPLRQMQEVARRVATVFEECKLATVGVEEYVEQFNPGLAVVVYQWAHGASFVQVCKASDAFEGSIIRAMRRLQELLMQLCAAAKVSKKKRCKLEFIVNLD